MRTLTFGRVAEAVERLCIQTACSLPEDTEAAVRGAADAEESPLGRKILGQYLVNADIARTDRVPVCQDTGTAVYFVRIGRELRIEGGTLRNALEVGTEAGFRKGFLRKSIVRDPLFDRTNTGTNTPAVIHVEETEGDGLSVVLALKGGGSENMSSLKMCKPSEGKQGIIDFTVESMMHAGANTCPPVVIGIGIGGNFETAPFLAKKALMRRTGEPHPEPDYAALEQEILEAVNRTGIGPQGLGGSVTAFAVHIETAPCHIASMPVAVNFNCHAARHGEVRL